jgi:pimeloyl-ACP methyl ester carboxylesterase
MKFDAIISTYEGKLSDDGASIQGTWTQGPPLPLELKRASKETAWRATNYQVQFLTVDNVAGKDVKLEVVDWGGSGRPLVLLAGLGNTAHTFEKFAPKLTAKYHVYGITRRGFGESSSPASGYSADRLADDILSVCDSLKLSKPILVGHSIAGEELSSIGSRHPEKVAALVYLDAGYSYAFYDRSRGDLLIDSMEFQRKLEQLLPGRGPRDPTQLTRELLEALPQLEKDLRQQLKDLETSPPPPQTAPRSQPGTPLPPPLAIMAGQQKYTELHVPALVIYASPHAGGPTDPATRAAADARVEMQAKAFETAVPSAHVVRIANANHFVFVLHEADVLREMTAFLGSLP